MSRSKFSNKKTAGFLATIPAISVENSGLISRCKFNFSYLDLTQPANLADDLTLDFYTELFDKLKNYSTHSSSFWTTEAAGRGNGVMLEVYGKFPKKSDFTHPTSVPHDAVWARFRMDRTVRLAGFFVPPALNHNFCEKEKYRFCTNTFYVVFIDIHHRFWVSS